MSLETISMLMTQAKAGGYAVGYFESWSLDSLQGVVDAAEQTRSPIIIGFNGEFLSERAGAVLDDLSIYGAMGAAIANKASVPVGFIFNECREDVWTERALTAGFNLVMPAGGDALPGGFTARVKRLADLAHAHRVAIESELESAHDLPEGQVAEGLAHHHNLSDPEEAAAFAAATGVDLLAVVAGNEEIKLHGRSPLDLDRLEAIHRVVPVPLVLHGGTGIDDTSLKAAIGLGVRKVNFGTYMKQVYLAELRRSLATDELNPHALLGDGSDTDLMVVGRRVVRDAVLARIELLGCCGQA